MVNDSSGDAGNKMLFERQSRDYAAGRPDYPQALYDYIKQHCLNYDIALDCAAGTGQASTSLSHGFNRVVAFDISPKQIHTAKEENNISYLCATAEDIPLADKSVDLVTVAEAAHWFDLKCFYPEVMRVLKDQGSLALWCYYLPNITPEVDAIVNHYYETMLKPYADSRRDPIKTGYKDISFPFYEVTRKVFISEKKMDFAQMLSNLRSSSACQTYKEAKGHDPVVKIEESLRKAWGNNEFHTAKWEVNLVMGMKPVVLQM